MTTAQKVSELYIGYLGRAPDPAGLNYWIDVVDRGVISIEGVRTNFVFEQPEYAAVYGGLDRAQTVARIYNNLFEREFDPEGFEYWVNGGGSVVPEDNLIAAFLVAAGSTDRDILDAKLAIAEGYTTVAGNDFYHSSSAAAIVDGVTHDPASYEAASRMLLTVQEYINAGSGNGAPLIGMRQTNPGTPDSIDVAGHPGQPDIFMFNTFNFDASGDIVRLTNFDLGDQLFMAHTYVNRVASPNTGANDMLEVFLEEDAAGVRMSVETSLAGANAAGPDQLVTILLVGTTLDEIVAT